MANNTGYLNSVQAQRAIAVLTDTLEKLQFLGSITPDVLAHRDELSQFVGDEISRIIDEQRSLERKYEALIAQRVALKGLANKTKYKENQLQIQEVSRALRESTKNLCRNLKDNPNVSGNLMKLQDERNELQELISNTISEIEDNGTFTVLADFVEDARSEHERVKEIVEREKQATQAVKDLEREIEREKAEHDREVKERKQTILHLKDELHEIRSKLSLKTKYARKEAEAKTASKLRDFSKQERKLRNEIEKLQKLKEMEQSVHQNSISFLARKQEQLIELAAEWSEKYTADLEEMDQRLRSLNEKRDRDLERLHALQARRDKEIADREAREEEKRLQTELEELRAKQEQESNAAAMTIQRHFRKHLQTTNTKKRKTKGKKGKKGKKK